MIYWNAGSTLQNLVSTCKVEEETLLFNQKMPLVHLLLILFCMLRDETLEASFSTMTFLTYSPTFLLLGYDFFGLSWGGRWSCTWCCGESGFRVPHVGWEEEDSWKGCSWRGCRRWLLSFPLFFSFSGWECLFAELGLWFWVSSLVFGPGEFPGWTRALLSLLLLSSSNIVSLSAACWSVLSYLFLAGLTWLRIFGTPWASTRALPWTLPVSYTHLTLPTIYSV